MSIYSAASGETIYGGRFAPVIPNINAPNAHAVNLVSGKVYYSKANAPLDHVASLTKMMTIYTLLQYRPTLADLQQSVTITDGDLSAYTYNMEKNDVLTLHALIANALLPSDNAAADAIARTIGLELLGSAGTETAAKNRFLVEMKAKSDTLGMPSAVWKSPSGLGACYCSPADVNKLWRALYTNPILLALLSASTYAVPILRAGVPITRTVTSTNPVVNRTGVFGGKTGTLAKYNLGVLWQSPSGQKIALTTIGAASGALRAADMNALLNALPIDYPELA